MLVRLGDLYPGPTPVYDYYGRLVDPSVPATAADCLPFQCGAQAGNTNAHFWCAYWGRAGNYSGCTDSRCAAFRPSYCVVQYNAPLAQPTQAAPAAPAAAPAPAAPSSPTAAPAGGTAIVQTPTGPVVVPASVVPGASGPLTPAQVHVPNVWDSLDPSKISQFEFRGLSTSLPFWISAAFRDSLRPKPVTVPGAVAPLEMSAVPGWVWLLILGALLLLRNNKHRRRRSVKHGK